MSETNHATAAVPPEASTLFTWRIVQSAVWAIGIAIVAALIFFPEVGLHAFWNVLIPVAPALLVIAPGLWRNICPLASTGLFPRHLGLSRRRILPAEWSGILAVIGLVLLLALVPLRHVVLDLDGPATAIAIISLAVLAFGSGLIFEWKSAWCSGLCPVHPVEKLYGQRPAVSLRNAHCGSCHRCSTPCPDSTPNPIRPRPVRRTKQLVRLVMVGGFAGFVWGWFQVPDFAGNAGWQHLGMAYGFPFAGLVISLAAYLALRSVLPTERHELLFRGFAAAALIVYYWYRLPALIGFGPFPGDGMLFDLRATAPLWLPWTLRVATTAFFAYWFLRRVPRRSWSVRPQFAVTSR